MLSLTIATANESFFTDAIGNAATIDVTANKPKDYLEQSRVEKQPSNTETVVGVDSCQKIIEVVQTIEQSQELDVST